MVTNRFSMTLMSHIMSIVGFVMVKHIDGLSMTVHDCVAAHCRYTSLIWLLLVP
jgi:hypothetical protein